MLDKGTGELYIESIPVMLGPSFTRRALSSTPVAAQSKVVNEPYHSYSLGQQRIAGQLFFVGLCFYGQQLECIDLAHAAAEFGTSWDDWSEERELKLKQWHDDWLRGQTGYASHVYKWGAIGSAYDPRSGSSSITIRYSWKGQAWPRVKPTVWRKLVTCVKQLLGRGETRRIGSFSVLG